MVLTLPSCGVGDLVADNKPLYVCVCVCANAKNNRGVKHRTNNTSTGACSNQTVFKNMIVLTMWSQFLGFFFFLVPLFQSQAFSKL